MSLPWSGHVLRPQPGPCPHQAVTSLREGRSSPGIMPMPAVSATPVLSNVTSLGNTFELLAHFLDGEDEILSTSVACGQSGAGQGALQTCQAPKASTSLSPSQRSAFRGGKGGENLRGVKSKPGKIDQKNRRRRTWRFYASPVYGRPESMCVHSKASRTGARGSGHFQGGPWGGEDTVRRGRVQYYSLFFRAF